MVSFFSKSPEYQKIAIKRYCACRLSQKNNGSEMAEPLNKSLNQELEDGSTTTCRSVHDISDEKVTSAYSTTNIVNNFDKSAHL